MANSLEPDGRGASDRQLLGVRHRGGCWWRRSSRQSLLIKATGRLDPYVRVVAALINVGDGLPQRSDVKYHGVLVGMVNGVTPAANGEPNYVHIDLNPTYAASIPASVTARVVPSNVFAVSSVQLVDRGPGPAIRAGAKILEDTELPTVLFQTTISKLRDILAATGRGREDKTVGILAAVNAATENRRTELLTSGAQLNRLVDELDAIVATEPGPDDGLRADRRHPRAAADRAGTGRRTAQSRTADADPGGAARTAHRADRRRRAHHGYDAHRAEQPHRPAGEDHR